MQSGHASRKSNLHPRRKAVIANARDRLPRRRPTLALVAAASLAVCGCAIQEDLRSVSYEYTPQRRLAAERRVDQEMQDSCYLSGAQRFEEAGPPKVLAEQGPAGPQYRATQSFYCVGTQGGP